MSSEKTPSWIRLHFGGVLGVWEWGWEVCKPNRTWFFLFLSWRVYCFTGIRLWYFVMLSWKNVTLQAGFLVHCRCPVGARYLLDFFWCFSLLIVVTTYFSPIHWYKMLYWFSHSTCLFIYWQVWCVWWVQILTSRGALISSVLEFENKKQILGWRVFSSLFE